MINKLEKTAAPEDVIKLATVCADEAESAELTQNDTYANASLCARIKAASERTALAAPAKKDATEAAARAAADIANLKAEEAAAERSKLGEAVMSCTTQIPTQIIIWRYLYRWWTWHSALPMNQL